MYQWIKIKSLCCTQLVLWKKNHNMMKIKSSFIEINIVANIIKYRKILIKITAGMRKCIHIVLDGISHILRLFQSIIDLHIQLIVGKNSGIYDPICRNPISYMIKDNTDDT